MLQLPLAASENLETGTILFPSYNFSYLIDLDL